MYYSIGSCFSMEQLTPIDEEPPDVEKINGRRSTNNNDSKDNVHSAEFDNAQI